MARRLHARPLMRLPLHGPGEHEAEAHLPEVVPIEGLSSGALEEAAEEIAHEHEEEASP